MRLRNLLISFVFMLVFSSLSKGQILQNGIVSQPVISLGQMTNISFQFNPLTTCDSWVVTTDIDYLLREVKIAINYNFIENCDDASSSIFVSDMVAPLFTGQYNVTIEVDVNQDFTLNETLNLFSLIVDAPDTDCNENNVTILDLCPLVFDDPVCACNGQLYDNECVAYIEEQQGKYYQELCSDILVRKAELDLCTDYTSMDEGSFYSYNCNNDYYPGNEIIIKYQHDGQDIIMEYNQVADQEVFLVEIDNGGSIDCKKLGENGLLDIARFASGDYYIIIDSKLNGDLNFNICPQVVGVPAINERPPPYTLKQLGDQYSIEASQDISLVLVSMDGRIVWTSAIDQGSQVRLPKSHGISLIQIHAEGKSYTERLVYF